MNILIKISGRAIILSIGDNEKHISPSSFRYIAKLLGRKDAKIIVIYNNAEVKRIVYRSIEWTVTHPFDQLIVRGFLGRD